jgi:hypothetical protein
MKIKIKQDYYTFLLTEFIALIQDKYKFENNFIIIDSKTSWELYKPTFNFQIYTPEEAEKYNTVYTLNFCYIKVTRKLYKK